MLFCVIFLDNRPANPSHDRTVPDLNNRLPNTTRGLPENSVYPCVTVYIWSSATSAHTASSGASGPGTVLHLFLFIFMNAILSLASMAAEVNKNNSQSWTRTLCNVLLLVNDESEAFVNLPLHRLSRALDLAV